MDQDGAEYLIQKKIRTIGVDYLSLEKFDSKEYEEHKMILSKEIGLKGGLNLNNVKQGIYFFAGFPLKLMNTEGAMTRTVLIEFDSNLLFGKNKFKLEII